MIQLFIVDGGSMDSEMALTILLQNIHDRKDLSNYENRWILHSIYVGLAARRIANELGVDEDFALTIGYMHDIGRMINHKNHVIEGYNYLNDLGFHNVARYCMTHSFIDNIIFSTAGGGPKDRESYNIISNYLDKIRVNVYDNIIQLCDLFCLETGFTTFEKRILDITERKGVYSNSEEHYVNIMKLKSKIEFLMGKTIYELFPEIKKEDLDSIEEDNKKLMVLFKNSNNKIYKKG